MFSWDVQKALFNWAKHDFSFEEAITIFSDPEGLDFEDSGHSQSEARFKRLGESINNRVLLVIYTIRRSKNGKETIRIISARSASRKERKAYRRLSDRF